MSKAFSLYLDFVRFSAAVLVFLWHTASLQRLDSLWFRLGHEAVIIFFVLSGFVIAFCRDQKEVTLSEYAVNRASRIYSVALPAVLITVALDLGCAWLAPETYGAFYDYPLVRFVSSMLFTNELWFVSIQSFSNAPYWSLNYEVAYYVLFGILAYVTRYRWLLFALACLVIGPKILLLAPCWWFGVWIYRSDWFERSTSRVNLLLFIATWGAFFTYISLRVAWWSWSALDGFLDPATFKLLSFSKHFLTDYALAVIIGLNFGAARMLMHTVEVGENLAVRTVRALAATTFALYLLHQPFLKFAAEVFAPMKGNALAYYLLVVSACLVIIIPGGYYLEGTKRYYRKFFHHVVVALKIPFCALGAAQRSRRFRSGQPAVRSDKTETSSDGEQSSSATPVTTNSV